MTDEQKGQTITNRPYHNPIIRGTHPDPSLCRVGEDYYLCTSTFACFPAAPIFHTTTKSPSPDETSGTFTGMMLALYATGNGEPAQTPADFDWCEMTGAAE
jgi:hypothetical protein